MEANFAPRPPPEIIDIDDDSDNEGPGITNQALLVTSSALGNTFSDFESEDEKDDENELEQKPLIAPSTDIRGDFEAALQDGFDFDGVFAFSERYAIGGAPNPCLNIDGLGTVGIPLSERDARAIVSASAPVSVSGSEATATGVWEMPSEKIHFDNPAWDVWIQKTAGVAASTALNACVPVAPSFRLKKLVIHEVGSQTTYYKEPIDEDDSNTKIGDFIAVLPGLFQGAHLQLRHGGQSKSLNFAHQSGLSTSIVAAYSGVEHALAGVASGHRLSLVYDIVQPIAHAELRPMLPEMQGATQKLHNIMLSWKQDASGEAPESLACLLQHKYTNTPNFRAQSLTGVDALLISHLYPLARELKFCIYLAHIQVTRRAIFGAVEEAMVAGAGGEITIISTRKRTKTWTTRDIDEGEFEDDEGSREEYLVFTKVVDLRGMPVNVDIDLEANDLLNGAITDQDPDDERFEREERTVATRTQIYKRTVLLIWPKDGDAELGVSAGDIYDYACNTLRSSFTVAPTETEKKLVDRLLECCRTRPQPVQLQRVVQVLRESADRWNDVRILLRALTTCGVDKNTDLMGVEGFVSAYQAFGWDALKDFYGDAMRNDASNARRHALLARLTQMAVEEEDAEVSTWCSDQAESILRSLSNIDVAQIPWLADVGLSRGGEFLRDIIIPQLQAQKLDKAFWIAFVQRLQQSMKDIPTTSPEVVSGLIVQCVSETARNLPAFPTRLVKSTQAYPQLPDRPEQNSAEILEVVKLCVETKNEALCVGIFSKMRDAARLGTFPPELPPWSYYAELFPSLSQYTQSIPTTPALIAAFRPFFVDVIDSMISAAPGAKGVPPCPLNEQHKVIVMHAARKAGGISVLKQRLNADALKGRDSTTLQELARSVMKEFPRQLLQDNIALQAHSELINTLLHTAIRILPAFPTRVIKTPRYGYGYQVPDRQEKNSEATLEVVKLCVETNSEPLCAGIFTKMRDAARLGTFPPEFPPWLYYAELLPPLSQLHSVSASPVVFQAFFLDVIDSMISAKRTMPGGKTITPCPLTEQHKSTIMLAARKAGGISVLKQRLNADALKGHDSNTLQGLAQAVAREFPRQQLLQDGVALQAYSDVIIALVRTAIDTFDTSSLVKKPTPYYNPSDRMLLLVKFCFEIGAQSQCQRLLLRFVPPPKGSTVPEHISNVLAPFLPVLRQYLAGQRLDFQTDPYKMFAAAVVKAFAEKVMTQKPHEVVPAAQMQGIGCGICTECKLLKDFFCSDKLTISFARAQTIRTHLERQLQVARPWGVVYETIKGRSPNTLKITKPASMTALGLWFANSEKGKTLLGGLGDPAMQTRILGADYPWVCARIHYGTATPPMPLANAYQILNAQKRPAPAELPTVPVTKKAKTS
ncbi:hypothetical protein DFH09DRAFT_1368280 [Mycena vulgaris]|nr:hypothetical protein DFH09DRAFT_1368280 [Mycena vulgaris]